MPSHPRTPPFSFLGLLLLTIVASNIAAVLSAGLLGLETLKPVFEGPVGPIVFVIALIVAIVSFYRLLRMVARH